MKNILSKTIASIVAGLSPLVAFAQIGSNAPSGSTNTLADLARLAVYYFNIAIEVILGLAVVVFIFNIYRYFFTTKENKERGMYLLWSIIGFAVILCFWGIVNLVSNTFNLNNYAPSMFGGMFGSGNSSVGAGSLAGSSGMCGTTVIPPNGGGYIYSCQNGNLTATQVSP